MERQDPRVPLVHCDPWRPQNTNPQAPNTKNAAREGASDAMYSNHNVTWGALVTARHCEKQWVGPGARAQTSSQHSEADSEEGGKFCHQNRKSVCEDRELSSTWRGRCLVFLSQEEKADGKGRLVRSGASQLWAHPGRTKDHSSEQPSASSVDLSSPGRESGYHHSITQEQAHHQDA